MREMEKNRERERESVCTSEREREREIERKNKRERGRKREIERKNKRERGRKREKESAQTFPIALNTKNRFLRKKPEFFFEKPILVFCWAPRN